MRLERLARKVPTVPMPVQYPVHVAVLYMFCHDQHTKGRGWSEGVRRLLQPQPPLARELMWLNLLGTPTSGKQNRARARAVLFFYFELLSSCKIEAGGSPARAARASQGGVQAWRRGGLANSKNSGDHPWASSALKLYQGRLPVQERNGCVSACESRR